MKPDIFKKMSFEQYAEVEACHKSALKHTQTGKHLRLFESAALDTDALRFGKLFHEVLFDGADVNEFEVFAEQEWIQKKDHPEGVSVNEQKALWRAERELYFSNADEKARLVEMVDALLQHPLARKYIEAEGDSEVSLFWTDEKTGLPCKTRLDKLLANGVIVEVKTDTDPSPETFGRKAYKMQYQVGAWFNREGYRAVFGKDPEAFIFIVIEKTEPFSIGVYYANAHDFDSGEIYGVEQMFRYKHIKQGMLNDHNQAQNGEYEALPLHTPQWELKIIDDEMGEIEAPEEMESEL